MREWVGDLADTYMTGFTVYNWAHKTCKPVTDQTWSLVIPLIQLMFLSRQWLFHHDTTIVQITVLA